MLLFVLLSHLFVVILVVYAQNDGQPKIPRTRSQAIHNSINDIVNQATQKIGSNQKRGSSAASKKTPEQRIKESEEQPLYRRKTYSEQKKASVEKRRKYRKQKDEGVWDEEL
jgi:hypothetical protein